MAGLNFCTVDVCAALAACSIDALADVSTPAPTAGQVLTWNGTQWVAQTPAGGGGSFTVAAASGPSQTISAGDTLQVNGVGIITAVSAPDTLTLSLDATFACSFISNASINCLSDVDTVSVAPSYGDVLFWNGVEWSNFQWSFTVSDMVNGVTINYGGDAGFEGVNGITTTSAVGPSGPGSSKVTIGLNAAALCTFLNANIPIDCLSNVVAPTPATGDLLGFNGTNWVPVQRMSQFLVSADTGTTQTITDNNTLQILGGAGVNTAASATDTVTISIVVDSAPGNILTNGADGPRLTAANVCAALATCSIDALGDVVVTTPTAGQVLSWNGTNWVNTTPAGGGGSFTVAAASGPSQTISAGDTLQILAGNGLTTAASATDTVTVNVVLNPSTNNLLTNGVAGLMVDCATLYTAGTVTSGKVLLQGNADCKIETLADPACNSTIFTPVQIGRVSATAWGEVYARERLPVRSTATSTSLAPSTDGVIRVTAGGQTITLAAPGACDSNHFHVKKTVTAGNMTIAAQAGSSIDGAASFVVAAGFRTSIHLFWNGATWDIL